MKTWEYASKFAYGLAGLVLLGYTTVARAGHLVIGPSILAPAEQILAIDDFGSTAEEMGGMEAPARFSDAIPGNPLGTPGSERGRDFNTSVVVPEPASAALLMMVLVALIAAIPYCRRRFDQQKKGTGVGTRVFSEQ